jgi:hypothetical protein
MPPPNTSCFAANSSRASGSAAAHRSNHSDSSEAEFHCSESEGNDSESGLASDSEIEIVSGESEAEMESNGAGSQEPWECGACTFHNRQAAVSCTMCGTRKPVSNDAGGGGGGGLVRNFAVGDDSGDTAAAITTSDASNVPGSVSCESVGVAPDEYLCPITGEMMSDPVIALDGHSYERSAIEKWFKTSSGRR